MNYSTSAVRLNTASADVQCRRQITDAVAAVIGAAGVSMSSIVAYQ